ncbi:MAG: flagellar biosynthesis repressor FlbT [Hyphomicrobiaceae bacterium]|nr:MAG: flagellar biosynthesis repressor FlbT [Hyphomicrobiaceae bacterium]
MKKAMHISLRPGEKLYVNGAVLRVDRKVSVEFLNDVTFLLENHVIQPEEANTPLRQLYFVVQTMLIDPANAAGISEVFQSMHPPLLGSFQNPHIIAGLRAVDELIGRHRVFDALKTIRSLFPLEEAILMQAKEANGDSDRKQLEAASCK